MTQDNIMFSCPFRIKSSRTTGALLALIAVSWSTNLLVTQNWGLVVLFRGRPEQRQSPRVIVKDEEDATMSSLHSHNHSREDKSFSSSPLSSSSLSLVSSRQVQSAPPIAPLPNNGLRVNKAVISTTTKSSLPTATLVKSKTIALVSEAPSLSTTKRGDDDYLVTTSRASSPTITLQDEEQEEYEMDDKTLVQGGGDDDDDAMDLANNIPNQGDTTNSTTRSASKNAANSIQDALNDSDESNTQTSIHTNTELYHNDVGKVKSITKGQDVTPPSWENKLLHAWQAFEKETESTRQENIDVIKRQTILDNKPQYDVTITTFASTAQLPRLLDLLTRWTGPVAVAVYMTQEQQVDAFANFYQSNQDLLDTVSFHVLFEKKPQSSLAVENKYLPEGVLRNLAMSQVPQDDFLIPLNVEYIVNTDCYEILLKLLRTNPRVRAFLQDRHFMILPAFESRLLDTESLDTAPATKEQVIERRLNQTADLTPMPFLKQGVYPTRFGKWARGGPGDMYVTEFEHGYEPIVLAYRKILPMYNQNFRGPWYTQVAMMEEADNLNYKFGVLWRAFVYRIDPRNDPEPEPFAKEQYQRFRDLLRKMYEYPLSVYTVQNIDQRDYESCPAYVTDTTKRKMADVEKRILCEWQNFTHSQDLRRQVVSAMPTDKKKHKKKFIDSDITLATQGSVDRLDRLLDGGSRWNGPISAAIYITKEESLVEFFDFHRKNRAALKQTTFHMFFEKISNVRDKDYPHNYLRNLAMNNIDTEFVINIDIDFCVNENAYEGLLSLIQSDKRVRGSLENKTMLVLPAFENSFHVAEEDVSLAPKDKVEVTKQVKELKTAEAFHLKKYYAGHGATKYEKWYANKTGPFYFTEYEQGFEPYVLAKKEGLPQFWTGFRGFGYNKRSWLEEAYRMGYNYGVLRDYFVFHVGQSSTQNQPQGWLTREYDYKFSAHLDKLYPMR